MSAAANIVFLLPDLGGGGAQQVMLTLARHLNRARFTPRLLVLGTNDIFAGNVPGDLPVERANASRLRNGLPWLVKRLRALRPDIVVSTLAYTNLALLAIGPLLPGNVRIIVREANTPDATLASLPAYVSGKWLYRWLYPRAARVLAQTDSIAKTLAAIAPGIRGKLSIMQNPVDVARLRQRAEMPRRAQGPGLRLIGAGRLTHQKGFDRLIEIAARLSHESRITIFGEGPDRGALSARIHALGLASRIELAGFTPDLPAHLAGADALVMPSRWEGLPNVALESLAVGTTRSCKRRGRLAGHRNAFAACGFHCSVGR